jgi:hypothetical protein
MANVPQNEPDNKKIAPEASTDKPEVVTPVASEPTAPESESAIPPTDSIIQSVRASLGDPMAMAAEDLEEFRKTAPELRKNLMEKPEFFLNTVALLLGRKDVEITSEGKKKKVALSKLDDLQKKSVVDDLIRIIEARVVFTKMASVGSNSLVTEVESLTKQINNILSSGKPNREVKMLLNNVAKQAGAMSLRLGGGAIQGATGIVAETLKASPKVIRALPALVTALPFIIILYLLTLIRGCDDQKMAQEVLDKVEVVTGKLDPNKSADEIVAEMMKHAKEVEEEYATQLDALNSAHSTELDNTREEFMKDREKTLAELAKKNGLLSAALADLQMIQGGLSQLLGRSADVNQSSSNILSSLTQIEQLVIDLHMDGLNASFDLWYIDKGLGRKDNLAERETSVLDHLRFLVTNIETEGGSERWSADQKKALQAILDKKTLKIGDRETGVADLFSDLAADPEAKKLIDRLKKRLRQ